MDEKESRIWFLATCVQCQITLPFSDEKERDGWAGSHAQIVDSVSNEHHTVVATEDRW